MSERQGAFIQDTRYTISACAARCACTSNVVTVGQDDSVESDCCSYLNIHQSSGILPINRDVGPAVPVHVALNGEVLARTDCERTREPDALTAERFFKGNDVSRVCGSDGFAQGNHTIICDYIIACRNCKDCHGFPLEELTSIILRLSEAIGYQ